MIHGLWNFLAVLGLSLALACQTGPDTPRVSPEQARNLIVRNEVRLLDVRTLREHEDRRIPGAQTLLPLQELPDRIGELGAQKTQPILVYCRSGNRSQQAVRQLIAAGFTRVMDLEGGIEAWTARGFATEGAPPPPRP